MKSVILSLIMACGLHAQQFPFSFWATQGVANNFKTSLVAYYSMEDSSGSGAVDSFAANNMTLNGTLGSAAGKISNCRTSSGSSANYLSLSSVAGFSPGSGNFTLTFWAKSALVGQGGAYPIVLSKDGNSSNEEWLIYIDAGANSPVLEVTSNGSSKSHVTATGSIFGDTSWHFVAAEWDGTNLAISVDGGAFATTGYTGSIFSGTGPVRMFADVSSSNSWDGSLDEVAFWKGRALTITEVGTLYNSGVGFGYSNFH
jgi:hypothetical protein